MEPAGEKRIERQPNEKVIVRALRHEVGDFLQSVYAMTALLQSRLPDEADMERRLAGELRGRAEMVRQVLDGLYALLFPEPLQAELLDLAVAAREAAAHATRFTKARCVGMAPVPVMATADPRLLREALTLLMLAAGRSARQEIAFTVVDNGSEAEIQVTHDGPAPTPEQRLWLERLLPTTHDLPMGLSLAFARHMAERHGGRAELVDLPEGRAMFRIMLPRAMSENAGPRT